MSDDVRLLIRYEPVIRYTAGELFLPTTVDGFLRQASLWRGAGCLVPAGELDTGTLAEHGRRLRGEPLHLRFVDRPLRGRAYRDWRRDIGATTIRPGDRLAAVGLASRLVDAALRVSLLVRGSVPGGTRAAAQVRYAARPSPDVRPYYGRVSRDGGYLVLQYWFFYAMNDWRSTFGGVNDHEADWEQVTVFVARPGGPPAWVVFSSHDKLGPELRRRWDDPELERVGEHPVVYAGAGSHAGAYRRGDYVTTVSWPWLEAAGAWWRAARRLVAPDAAAGGDGFGLPFLDYHRGDGPGIGPGERHAWTPVLIGDDTPWVRDYRGLWGLDTEDRFGGERAPAGPRYERDGTVRASWGYPVTWAGLDAEGPDPDAAAGARLREVTALIDQHRERARRLRAAAKAAGRPAPPRPDPDLVRLQAERVALQDGDPPPAPATPARRLAPPPGPARRRFLMLWSAVSASVVLGGAALIVLNPPLGVFWSAVALLGVLVAVEAVARGRLLRLLRWCVMAAVVLLTAWTLVEAAARHWRVTVAALLAVGAVALWVANLRAWLARR
ncbi:hypothetical protein Daura_38330 [Dactylosporangium aurantiacum]|uniref:Uncharacterized protein n=1 Tax=Dactylosporangium aurantiacum TaxID=35754 RepID=A0A9Q9MK35_9ACTN|nr:hypothetical protein [Dactylosporangium aurantiacum]MDG6101721.1 hypothetical protein [Dactylosporangium aurantiacum]UWZ52467.1 hypothetical protein Daura_38330 [Dactylosporangium aurantiacum]